MGGGPLTQLWEVHGDGWWEEGPSCSQGAGEELGKVVSISSPVLAWRVSPGHMVLPLQALVPQRGKIFPKSTSCLVELVWVPLAPGSQLAGEPQRCVAASRTQNCGGGLVHVLVPTLQRVSGEEPLSSCTPFPRPISTKCGRREWAEGTSALGQHLCSVAGSVARLCTLTRG